MGGRMKIYKRALSSKIVAIGSSLGLVLGMGLMWATPALAFTCPTGSTTFHTGYDANKFQYNANADNFGSGSDTCFTDGTDGQMTLTQTYGTSTINPTSYPDDGYGCGSSDCSYGWTSKLWSTPTMTLSGSMSNSGVASGSKYDDLVDSTFTTGTGDFSLPSAEVEIVTYAAPSYTGLGFCAATSCGATSVSIAGNSYWRSEKTASSGSTTWSDYLYVANTMTQSISSLPLATFYSNANGSGLGSGLGILNLGFVGYGNELWESGTGLEINSVLATNMP
jgi:hypothetical protein